MHLQIWFLLLIIPTLMAGTTGHNYDDDVNSDHSNTITYSDEYGDNFANMFGSVGYNNFDMFQVAKSAAQQIALGYSVKTHVPGDFDLFLDKIVHSQDDSKSFLKI